MSRWSSCYECGKAVRERRYQCATCQVIICPAHAYFYADESNAAITKSARPQCWVHIVLPGRMRGVLSYDNLLSSGDFADRDFSRSLFTIVLTPHGSRISSRSTTRTAGETMFESAEIRGRIGVAEVKARNAQTSEPSATPLPIRAFGAAPMSVPETPPVETVSGGN